MKEYYVVYSWSKKLSSGYGNIDIKTETDKLSLDLIKDIKAEIIKQCGGEISVSIINIIKMDE